MVSWSDFRLPPINLWSLPLFKKPKFSLRIDPLSANVRYYIPAAKSGPLHSMKDHYYKILTCQFLDNGHIRLTSMVEAPNIAESRLLAKELAKMGYLEVSYRHNGTEFYVDLTKKNYRIRKRKS